MPVIFTRREIDALRLLCWYRFIRPQYLNELVSRTEFHNLTSLGYIKHHEKSDSLTPTARCRSLIGGLFPGGVPALSPTYRESLIQRKVNISSIVLTAYRAGVNVFLRTAEELTTPPSLFMTAFARVENSNPWGSTRVAALAHLHDTLYAIHYVRPEIGKVALTDELTAFNNQTAQFQGVRRAMIFAGDSYADILAELEAGRPPLDTKLVHYGDAYRQLQWPIYLLPCNDTGAMQLKIMVIPNYRDRLAKEILGKAYTPPPEDVPQWDGLFQGLPFVMAADMDLRRADVALEIARQRGHEKIVMVCLKGEQKSLLSSRYDRTGKADVYQITPAALSAVLGDGMKLYSPAPTQYLTEKGDVVHAPLIKTR